MTISTLTHIIIIITIYNPPFIVVYIFAYHILPLIPPALCSLPFIFGVDSLSFNMETKSTECVALQEAIILTVAAF